MVEFFGPGGPPPPAGTDYLLSISSNCQPHTVRTAQVEVSLATDEPTATANGEIIYIVRIENNGNDQALDAEFTDVLPDGVLFEGIAGDGTDGASCSLLPTAGTNGTVRCRVECLRPGGFFEFYVFARAPQCTGDFDLVNTVTVTSKTTLVEGSVLEASTTTPVTDPGGCDDGLFCTSGDHCEGTACVGGFACDDSDPCTIDQCSEDTGCDNQFAEGNLCDDGNACTLIDICLLGDVPCVGFEEITCSDELNCTDNVCSSENPGTCEFPPADCEDGNVCTDNACDEVDGCTSSPNTGSCDDGNACTVSDTCGGGDCQPGGPLNCDDGNECTADACDPSSGCINTPIEGCTLCSADEPNPHARGYWKRLCIGPHSGDELTAADAACVAGLGQTFADVASVADICAVLSGSGGQCASGEVELMSMALNICHELVCPDTPIDSQYGDNSTVGANYSEADGILSGGGDCNHARGLGSEVNTGRAIAVDGVSFAKLAGGGAKVNWTSMGGGDTPVVKYNVWRRAAGSMAAFTKIGETTSLSFDDTTPGNFEYEVTPVR
jgi:uncharacterized repeat protein (TIGR01451 family)